LFDVCGENVTITVTTPDAQSTVSSHQGISDEGSAALTVL
jgi:hypothetical protein